MIKQYRKKPVVVEAIQWDGTSECASMISKFAEKSEFIFLDGFSLKIPTLAGVMVASLDDFIIKGVDGEIYLCKSDIFAQTYELWRNKSNE